MPCHTPKVLEPHNEFQLRIAISRVAHQRCQRNPNGIHSRTRSNTLEPRCPISHLAQIGAACLFLTAFAAGCKPSDEADRIKPRVFEHVDRASTEPVEDLDAWLHGSNEETATKTSPSVEKGNIASLNGPQTSSDRSKARQQLKQGLGLREPANIKKRIQAIESAIDTDPTWARPRFELAKTFARQKQASKAINALEGLVGLASVSGDNYLRRARISPEFELLHSEDAFRTATRFVPVEVSPARGTKNETLVKELVRGLRDRLIPAREGNMWKGKERATTVYYAKRNTSAEEAALEVVRSASLPPRVVSSKYLNAKRPVVLVLVESDTATAGSFLTDKRLEDYMGLPLTATSPNGVKHSFSLDKTGFFSWKTISPNGNSEEKTGRYHVSSNRLSFSYRLITRNNSGEVLRTEQGRRSASSLQLREQGLLLGSLHFRIAPSSP